MRNLCVMIIEIDLDWSILCWGIENEHQSRRSGLRNLILLQNLFICLAFLLGIHNFRLTFFITCLKLRDLGERCP